MGKIQIIRNFKTMQSGLKDFELDKVVVPCRFNMNMFTYVTDVDELVEGVYVLKNTRLNYESVLGVYFKNSDYLLTLSDCQVTLFHYTDFNVLFTHDYNSHDYKSAIIFSDDGKFLNHLLVHKISEYNKEDISKLGILTDSERVYLIDNEFYTVTKDKYPFAINNTYPFTRLKDQLLGCCETAFGQKMIAADSITEYDYKMENMESKMQDIYMNNSYLKDKYPKVKVK